MAEIKGTNEYYTVSTLYALGTILAYHRILLLERMHLVMHHMRFIMLNAPIMDVNSLYIYHLMLLSATVGQ